MVPPFPYRLVMPTFFTGDSTEIWVPTPARMAVWFLLTSGTVGDRIERILAARSAVQLWWFVRTQTKTQDEGNEWGEWVTLRSMEVMCYLVIGESEIIQPLLTEQSIGFQVGIGFLLVCAEQLRRLIRVQAFPRFVEGSAWETIALEDR